MRLMMAETPEAGGIEGEIHMLGVDPDFRRMGIGRKVLLAGLSHLKCKGVTIVRLTADGEDPAALALYESVGFKRASRIEWYEKRLA
jgi:mycothiol synthase